MLWKMYLLTEVNCVVLKSHLSEVKRPRVIHLSGTPSPRSDNGILDRPCVSTEAKQPLSKDRWCCSVLLRKWQSNKSKKGKAFRNLPMLYGSQTLACLSEARHRCFVLPCPFPTLLLQWPRSCPLQVAPPRSLPNALVFMFPRSPPACL